MLPVAVICLLVASATAQTPFTPDTDEACNGVKVRSGSSLLPHGTYCQLYRQCIGVSDTTTGIEKQCGTGLLWDVSRGICNWPALSTCSAWPCDSSINLGRLYPDICCTKYWRCTGSGFEQWQCDAGYVYSSATGSCVLSTQVSCSNNLYCEENLRNLSTACGNIADGTDACKFQVTVGGVTYTKDCAAGAAFSQSTCSCTEFSGVCVASLDSSRMTENKKMDASCRASMRLDFSTSSLQTFSDKVSPSLLPYTYQLNGAVVTSSGFVTLGSTIAVPTPYVFSYFFANNQLALPLGIVIEFCPTNSPSQGTQIDLYTNQYTGNMDCSSASISATATRTNSGWSFTQTIQNSAGTTYTASSSLTSTSSNNCIRYTTMVSSTTFTSQAVDRGSSNNQALSRTTGQSSVTPDIPTFAAYNQCGWSIARGLTGTLRRFDVYEGCGNFNNLLV